MSYNHREALETARICEETAEERKNFKAEWTLEVTKQRRIDWNEASKNLNPGHKLTAREMLELVEAIENTVGFNQESLVEAVRMHSIQGTGGIGEP